MFNLEAFKRARPLDSKEARLRTLEWIKQYEEAEAELHRVCKEKGLTVPRMIC